MNAQLEYEIKQAKDDLEFVGRHSPRLWQRDRANNAINVIDALEKQVVILQSQASSAHQSERDKAYAERYRWIREQQWNSSNLFVVAGGRSLVVLGADCPNLDRLDAAIDAARAVQEKVNG